jgi:hypothetical protein
MTTLQRSPILALAVATLVGGGRGGVGEARVGLSGATAQSVERSGSIRAGPIAWVISGGWSVSRCPRDRWVMPCWTCPPACCPRGLGPRRVVGRLRDRCTRRHRTQTGGGSREPRVLGADGPRHVNRAIPVEAALTLCQARLTPEAATRARGTVRPALTRSTAPT